jgi:hypothetical protein
MEINMKKLLYTHILALVLLSNASYAAKDTPIDLANINIILDEFKENDQPIITENESIINFTDYDVPNFMLYPNLAIHNLSSGLKLV